MLVKTKAWTMKYTTITHNISTQNYHEFWEKVKKKNAYNDSQSYFLIYINYYITEHCFITAHKMTSKFTS